MYHTEGFYSIMETQEIKWISVEEKLPDFDTMVLIKTDCPDCPEVVMMYYKEFVPAYIQQCDHHYETDEKFIAIKLTVGMEEVRNYTQRITHWIELKDTQ